MTPQEYHYYSQGFIIRQRIREQPFRRLYRVIYNVNVRERSQITNETQLGKHFPLFADTSQIESMSREYMIETFRQQLAASQFFKATNN